MNKPFFSIIIPVYNVEKYINECVESVLNQSYNNYEIILVDDGSTDNSGIICNEYNKSNDNIIVIHKKNGGLSSARNEGIKVAVGDYILFLDSDDYWDNSNCLQSLYNKIQAYNADVFVFGSKLLYPNGKISDDSFELDNKYYQSSIDNLSELIKRNLIIGSACTKAINRLFLLKNNLYFKFGIKSEDIEWIFRLSSALPSYYMYNEHFYIYRQKREGSITNNININSLFDIYNFINDYCENDFYSSEIKNVFYNYVSYQFAILCAHTFSLENSSNKKSLINKIKKLKWLYNYNLNCKMKYINIIYSLFGFYISGHILKIFLKIKK